MADLQGKIALVTGASQGIGRACALELAKVGATVALAARNEAKLAEVAAEIAAAGGQAAAFALDVASEESIKAGAKAVLDRFGKVEILVNNAGITRDGLMMRMKRADWDDVLGTNLTGAFLLTQALLPVMLRNRWGRIINITSVVGRTGQAGQVNYAASKAGLIGFTRSLAREVASRNVTVNAVAPGYIETPMTAALDEKHREVLMVQIPLDAPAPMSRSRSPWRSSRPMRPPTSPATCSTSTAACSWADKRTSMSFLKCLVKNGCVIVRTRAFGPPIAQSAIGVSGAKDLIFTLLQSARKWAPHPSSAWVGPMPQSAKSSVPIQVLGGTDASIHEKVPRPILSAFFCGKGGKPQIVFKRASIRPKWVPHPSSAWVGKHESNRRTPTKTPAALSHCAPDPALRSAACARHPSK